MHKLKAFAALSLCLAAATCTALQQQEAVQAGAIGATIACNAIYGANAAKDALCLSATGQLVTVAQAISSGQTK